MLFESNDASIVETLETKLGEKLNQRLEVVDAWDGRNQFPANAKPLFKTEQELLKWLAKASRA